MVRHFPARMYFCFILARREGWFYYLSSLQVYGEVGTHVQAKIRTNILYKKICKKLASTLLLLSYPMKYISSSYLIYLLAPLPSRSSISRTDNAPHTYLV